MRTNSFTTSKFYISTPKIFDFWRTVYSHGWCALKPFVVDKEKLVLKRLFKTRSAELVFCNLIDQIAKVFRLDEDLTGFYTEAKRCAIQLQLGFD